MIKRCENCDKSFSSYKPIDRFHIYCEDCNWINLLYSKVFCAIPFPFDSKKSEERFHDTVKFINDLLSKKGLNK